MSNRERWIVYPLLLFTLLMNMSRKLVESGSAEFGTIQCQELVVAAPDGSQRIALRQDPAGDGGLITVYGLTQSLISRDRGTDAVASVRSRIPASKLELGVDDIGGYVRVLGADGLPELRLGHIEQERASGLVATDPNGILLAAAGEDGAWGPRLAWADVPDSRRDYDEAMAGFDERAAAREELEKNDGAAPATADSPEQESPVNDEESESRREGSNGVDVDETGVN